MKSTEVKKMHFCTRAMSSFPLDSEWFSGTLRTSEILFSPRPVESPSAKKLPQSGEEDKGMKSLTTLRVGRKKHLLIYKARCKLTLFLPQWASPWIVLDAFSWSLNCSHISLVLLQVNRHGFWKKKWKLDHQRARVHLKGGERRETSLDLALLFGEPIKGTSCLAGS